MDKMHDEILARFSSNFAGEQASALKQERLKGADIERRIFDVYVKVGQMLSQYKSGKFPKALKTLPALNNWEVLLRSTEPQKWTPHATFQVVKIFAAALPPSHFEKFLREFIYLRIKSDFEETRQLHPQHYLALKKSLYKPASFFKGIMLPLMEDENTTIKDAAIIASIVSKSSIPMLFSAAALAKLLGMKFSSSRSLMIRTFLDKKYAFPEKLISLIISSFKRQSTEMEKLPVLWHQCLLVFVQRYKKEISADQVEDIKQIIGRSAHQAISREVLEELATPDTASMMDI